MKRLESNKRSRTRTIAFLIALVIAAGAFIYTFFNGRRERSGLRTVVANVEKDALNYSSGVIFEYYFSGRRAEIRSDYAALQADYSAALSRAYKLLDPVNTYPGLGNLASVNQGAGTDVVIEPELYELLRDALVRTEEGFGFSVFAGALYAAWDEILLLEDPLPFDPLNNETSAERLGRLAAATNDPENFRLTLTDGAQKTARLEVSERYRALLEELELSAPVLSFNVLQDACKLDLTAAALAARGWTRGHFTAESGLTVSLPAQPEGRYCFYGIQGNDVTPMAYAKLRPGSAACNFRAFPVEKGEYGFYGVESGGEVFQRFRYLTTAGFNQSLQSAFSIDPNGSAAEAACQCVRLFSADWSAPGSAPVLPETACITGWAFWGRKTVDVRGAGPEDAVAAAAEYGWELAS